MSILAGIKSFLGGGLGEEIVGFVRDRWPAKMSQAEKAEMEQALAEFAHAKEVQLIELGIQQDEQFNKRTKELEGTASDLKTIPVLGPIVIFSRGMFRPMFAYFTAYLDLVWFTTATGWSEQQNTAMIVINIIVLTFFFGERAVKNLAPLIAQVFGGKQ